MVLKLKNKLSSHHINCHINSESISEKCKKAHQRLHQLFRCTENYLFSCECNKTNTTKQIKYIFHPSIRILINIKYKSSLHLIKLTLTKSRTFQVDDS